MSGGPRQAPQEGRVDALFTDNRHFLSAYWLTIGSFKFCGRREAEFGSQIGPTHVEIKGDPDLLGNYLNICLFPREGFWEAG